MKLLLKSRCLSTEYENAMTAEQQVGRMISTFLIHGSDFEIGRQH